MKRSEMVINIAIELMSRLPEWEKQERLNFASEILQCIEMQGMLPPPSYVNPLSLDYDKGFIGEISYNYPQDKYGQFPFWEPEFKTPSVEKLEKAKETLKHILEREPEDEEK